MVCLPQSWDWLKNMRGGDDEIPREVWKIIKAKIRKIGVAKIKRRRKKIKREVLYPKLWNMFKICLTSI